MNEPRLDSTEELGRAHKALLQDLTELEAAVGSPSPDAKALVNRLDLTSKCLAQHFWLEEQNGYMETARARLPNLGPVIDKLKDEHARLILGVKELLATARGGANADSGFPTKVREFIEQVRGHETRENLLIEDAFNRDTGAKD